jgi:hypothetical protein
VLRVREGTAGRAGHERGAAGEQEVVVVVGLDAVVARSARGG